MEKIYNYHTNKILNFLRQNNYQGHYVYGGITEQDIIVRKNQHINTNQPIQCNNNWNIVEISHIKINNKYTINDYINIIAQLEQFLINNLNNIYGFNCVNNRNINGNIAQMGGNGLNNNNLQYGDKIKLYVFYG